MYVCVRVYVCTLYSVGCNNSNITSQVISIQSDNSKGSMIAIMPPAVAWSQIEIQDWKHVKPHLGTSVVWKTISAYERMCNRKTFAICELCFAVATLDAD